jgi:hypothetical protein
MKIAKIRPPYKKGNRQEISNYRPISALSIFSKNLEKIVFNRLVNFVSKYKILTGNQYGFQKNKSTISACQSFIGNAQEALNRQSFAVCIFFDLTKAYDVTDHDIVISLFKVFGTILLQTFLILRFLVIICPSIYLILLL